MNLSITADKVKQAAEKCPQAKETLKALFPEVFEDDRLIELDADFSNYPGYICAKNNLHVAGVALGYAPEGLKGRCIFLSKDFDWELLEEAGREGHTILIPRKK